MVRRILRRIPVPGIAPDPPAAASSCDRRDFRAFVEEAPPVSATGPGPTFHRLRHGGPSRLSAAAAAPFLSALLAPDAAKVVMSLLRLVVRDGDAAVDPVALARGAGLAGDDDAATASQSLAEAERSGLRLTVAAGPGDDDGRLRASEALSAALSRPPRHAPAAPGAPLDAATMAWIRILRAAADRDKVPEVGLHVAVRIEVARSHLLSDFTAHLAAAAGARVWVVPDSSSTAMAMLQAEIHGGRRPGVVVMPHSHLCGPATVAEAEPDWDDPVPDPGVLNVPSRMANLLAGLRGASNVYCWPIPHEGRIPTHVARRLGAVIGPVTPDAPWAEQALAAALPAAGGEAVRGLLAACGGDPRDAGPLLRAVRAAVAAGHSERAACALVAAPVLEERDLPRPPDPFDARLLVCREDATLLLRDAGRAFVDGGRILAYGPPGSGKTSYAQALAERLGAGSRDVRGRPTLVLTPSRILARAWGATERALRDLFARAEREGAVILADEWGSVCGVREAGPVSGGNAYLVRSLTDEVLRAMDAHPRVPLVATVNDLASVDPACHRRFTWIVGFGDKLSAAQERLAWTVLLRLDPPTGWRPSALAVADFAVAAARCRALRRTDAASHALALAEAKSARTSAGRRPPGTLLN